MNVPRFSNSSYDKRSITVDSATHQKYVLKNTSNSSLNISSGSNESTNTPISKKTPNLATQPYPELAHHTLRSHLSSPHLRPNSAASLTSYSSSNGTIMSSMPSSLSLGSNNNGASMNPNDLSLSSLSLADSKVKNVAPPHGPNSAYPGPDISPSHSPFESSKIPGSNTCFVSTPASSIVHTSSPVSMNHQSISSSSSVSTIENFNTKANIVFQQHPNRASSLSGFYTENKENIYNDANRSLTSVSYNTNNGERNRSVSLSPTKPKSVLLGGPDDECNNLPEFPDSVSSLNMVTPTPSHTNLYELPTQPQHQQFVSQNQSFGAIGSKRGEHHLPLDSFGSANNITGRRFGATPGGHHSHHGVSRSVSLSNTPPQQLPLNSHHLFSSSISLPNNHHRHSSSANSRNFEPIEPYFELAHSTTLSNPINMNMNTNMGPIKTESEWLSHNNTDTKQSVDMGESNTNNEGSIPDTSSDLNTNNGNNNNILGWSKVWGNNTTSVWG